MLGAPIPLLLTYYHNIGWTSVNRCYSSEFDDYDAPCSEEFHDEDFVYRNDVSSIHEIDTLHKEFVENIKKENETDSKTIYSRSGIPPWEYIQRVRHKGLPP